MSHRGGGGGGGGCAVGTGTGTGAGAGGCVKVAGTVWSTYRVIVVPWSTAVLPHLSILDSCRHRCTGTLRYNAASCRRSCIGDAAVTRTRTRILRCPFE